MKLRVGLIGLGPGWELRHRPALRALADRFEVRAICEEVGLRADQAARDFNASAVYGFRTLTRRSDIDAIVILSPQWFGPLPILAACDAGKAVYCAATFELEPEQASYIRQRVEQAGIAFMGEFPRRLAPATQRLKELIATRLGAPRLLFCHRRCNAPPVSENLLPPRRIWSGTRELLELVDWCRYIVGNEPTAVWGVQHRDEQTELPDYLMMSLDFSPTGQWGHGPMAQISCGHYLSDHWPEAISFRPPPALQVCCERGVAFVDLPAHLTWFDEAGRHMESLESERPVGEQLLSHFHRAVTSLVRKTCDLEDAYRAIYITQMARQSSLQGERVVLEL